MSDAYDEQPPDDPYESTPTAPKPDTLTMYEQGVIGGAIANSRTLDDLHREVASGDFHDMRLGRIFQGVGEMHLAGAHVDYLTVWDHLAGWDVRGIELSELSMWANTTSSAAVYYAGKVREASVQRMLAEIGGRMQEPGVDPGLAMARAAEDLRRLRDMSAGGNSVRWLREVLDVPDAADAYDWVIPNVLERQDRLMLSAAEGSGKTTLLRQMAILAAAGIHPFEFQPIDPVNVLVVDAENSERQWRRKSRTLTDNAAQRGRRDPRNHLALHCVPVMDITRPNDLGQIHRWIDEAKPDLILLGPLYRVSGGRSLNTDEDAAPVLAALDSIRDRGLAMLLEVHAGHAKSSSGERELRPRGSAALLGWPEFGLGLRKDKVRGLVPTYSLVRWRGDRDERDWPTLTRGYQQMWPWEPTY